MLGITTTWLYRTEFQLAHFEIDLGLPPLTERGHKSKGNVDKTPEISLPFQQQSLHLGHTPQCCYTSPTHRLQRSTAFVLVNSSMLSQAED